MQTGIEGLILATFLSGFLLIAVGTLKLGSYIRFIPYPVTVGFTAGIAVIIAASQMKELLGLTLAGPEPSALVEKVAALWAARETITPAALGVAVGTIAMIEGLKRLSPRLPSLLIAIVLASVAVLVLKLPVETIGTRFGELPKMLPTPALPALDREAILAALPWAVSFTLLGAIESLLSAVVADGMAGTQHRPNAELIAQGWANVGSALFGGFCVTGTIARTATNVRAARAGRYRGCCMRSSCWASCWWRPRLRPTSRWRRWRGSSPSWRGTCSRRRNSGPSCAPRAAMRWSCLRPSCSWCSGT